MNVSVLMRAEQVLHRDCPQGLFPAGWGVRGARSARTNRSRKCFGQRYAMVGDWGKARLVLSERWKMWWYCPVILLREGRVGD